ncbi:MAG: universal stress protein, partial [Betaproteobacteria bacterium]
MVFTSILVLTDFSADGDKALARAGQIALGHGAVLRLMYMPSGKGAECLDPDTRLAQTASAMSQRLGLTVRAVGSGDFSLDNIMLQAEHARLLVLPQRSGRGLIDSWF